MTGTRQFWEWTWIGSCSKSELACLSAKGRCCKCDADSFLGVLPVTTNIVKDSKHNLVWNSCCKLGAWSRQRLLVGPVAQSSDVHIICKLGSPLHLRLSLKKCRHEEEIGRLSWSEYKKVCVALFSETTQPFHEYKVFQCWCFPFQLRFYFQCQVWFLMPKLKSLCSSPMPLMITLDF